MNVNKATWCNGITSTRRVEGPRINTWCGQVFFAKYLFIYFSNMKREKEKRKGKKGRVFQIRFIERYQHTLTHKGGPYSHSSTNKDILHTLKAAKKITDKFSEIKSHAKSKTITR